MGALQSKPSQELIAYDQSTKMEGACDTSATSGNGLAKRPYWRYRLTREGEHLTTLPESTKSIEVRLRRGREELTMVQKEGEEVKKMMRQLKESSAPADQKGKELDQVQAKIDGIDLTLHRLTEETDYINHALERLARENDRLQRRLRILMAVTLILAVLYYTWVIWTVINGTFANDVEQLSGLICRLLGKDP